MWRGRCSTAVGLADLQVEDSFTRLGDLAAVRFSAYVEADRERVVDLVRATFVGPDGGPVIAEVKDRFDVVSGRFYRATHLDVALPEEELIGSFDNVRGVRCEVQVCSMLAHVWNEIEHDLVYKPLMGPVSIEEREALGRSCGVLVGDALDSGTERHHAAEHDVDDGSAGVRAVRVGIAARRSDALRPRLLQPVPRSRPAGDHRRGGARRGAATRSSGSEAVRSRQVAHQARSPHDEATAARTHAEDAARDLRLGGQRGSCEVHELPGPHQRHTDAQAGGDLARGDLERDARRDAVRDEHRDRGVVSCRSWRLRHEAGDGVDAGAPKGDRRCRTGFWCVARRRGRVRARTCNMKVRAVYRAGRVTIRCPLTPTQSSRRDRGRAADGDGSVQGV
ncbi:MAG: RelA/SpoT domain-containing protein [Gemmatimonadaceae bacterium]|nr:RelA/SpoT domain-containing protein [Gemmatimonadaceae bacterium]